MMEAKVQASPLITTNVPFLAFSATTTLLLLILLLLYRFCLAQTPPILAILALLLLNDIAELGFQLPVYVQSITNAVCLVSIVGTTFFRLASYYWLIFITRLLYRQKVTPGKFVDLNKYIGKYIIFTYIPSIAVALVILIAANVNDTSSESNCWRLISEKTVTDYIVYLSSFVMPDLIALVMIVVFLQSYFRFPAKTSHALLLCFPLLGILFIGYEMTLRMMIFFGEWVISNYLEVPFLFQPLCHGAIFAKVILNVYKGKKLNASDMTIRSADLKPDSFLQTAEQI